MTEAAARSGYSREALRQRVRRKGLPAVKGNDGILRVSERDLADLPPPDETSADDPGQDTDAVTDAALDVLQSTVVDLRSTVNKLTEDLGHARTTMDKLQADRMVDHGRAEREAARADAEAARAVTAEARLAAADAALAEARVPWLVKVARALRR